MKIHYIQGLVLCSLGLFGMENGRNSGGARQPYKLQEQILLLINRHDNPLSKVRSELKQLPHELQERIDEGVRAIEEYEAKKHKLIPAG